LNCHKGNYEICLKEEKMRRKVLIVVGFLCLLMAGQVQAQCTFSDVPESHNFYDYITGMCELGITTGYSDGTFRPGNNVTRGQMSAFLMRTIHRVYDANDQYLGNLFDMGDTCLKVFIPSLQKVICLSPFSGDIPYEHSLVFVSADCTGQAYITEESIMFRIVRNEEEYYTATVSVPELVNFLSSKHDDACSSVNWQDYAAPVYEVTVPFTLPVALPMRLE
jgi:hypothetical protein